MLTGELIGLDYLLHQGSDSFASVLDPMLLQEEPSQKEEEEVEENETDEGFLDCGDGATEDATFYPPDEDDHPRSARLTNRPRGENYSFSSNF